MSIGYAGNDLPHLITNNIIECGIAQIRSQLSVKSSKFCIDCGDKIPESRLKVIKTQFCLSCQSSREK